MSVADAARATRRYDWKGRGERWYAYEVESGNAMTGPMAYQQAKAACDRLNLLAVLETIREPSMEMAAKAAHKHAADQIPSHVFASGWRAMIDELIAEVMDAGNDT